MRQKESNFSKKLLNLYKNKYYNKIMKNNKKIFNFHNLLNHLIEKTDEIFLFEIKNENLEDFKITLNSILNIIKENYILYAKSIALVEMKVYSTSDLNLMIKNYIDFINLLSKDSENIISAEYFIKNENGKNYLCLDVLAKGKYYFEKYFIDKLVESKGIGFENQNFSQLYPDELIENSFLTLAMNQLGYNYDINILNENLIYLEKIYNNHIEYLEQQSEVEHNNIIEKIRKLENSLNIKIALHLNPSQTMNDRSNKHKNIEMKTIKTRDFNNLFKIIEKQLFFAKIEHSDQLKNIPLYSIGSFADFCLARYCSSNLYENNNAYMEISNILKEEKSYEQETFLTHEVQHYKSGKVLNDIYLINKKSFWKSHDNKKVISASYYIFEQMWNERKNKDHLNEIKAFKELDEHLNEFSKLMKLYMFNDKDFDFKNLSLSENYYVTKNKIDNLITKRIFNLTLESFNNLVEEKDMVKLLKILNNKEVEKTIKDFIFKNLQNNIVDAYILNNIKNNKNDFLNEYELNYMSKIALNNSLLTIDNDKTKDIIVHDLILICENVNELINKLLEENNINLSKIDFDLVVNKKIFENIVFNIVNKKTEIELKALSNKINSDEVPNVFYNAFLNDDIYRECINDKHFANSVKRQFYNKSINKSDEYYYYMIEADEIMARNTESYSIKKAEKFKKELLMSQKIKTSSVKKILSIISENAINDFSRNKILNEKVYSRDDKNSVDFKLSKATIEDITEKMLIDQKLIQDNISKQLEYFKNIDKNKIISFVEEFKSNSLLRDYLKKITKTNKKSTILLK